MDDRWFKMQQKRVGVTADQIADLLGRDRSVVSKIYSGKQRMTIEWAQAFAKAFDVPVATILEKAGAIDEPTALQIRPGFAEADAAPYLPQQGSEGREKAIAAAMGQRPGVDVWRVKSRAMALAGLIEGDFILVDTHAAERAKAGDVVVAQIYNPRGATTVLRRYQPPVLIAASADPADSGVHVVDGVNVVVRGKVIACWRT